MNQTVFSSRRTLRAVAGLIGASVALSGAPAHAQQSEIDLLRQQLAELQARLDKLETTQSAAAATIKTNTPTVATGSKLPLTISGLAQVHSLNFLDEDINNNGAPSFDTFRLRRAEIRLTAPSITPRISGTVMLDPAKITSLRGNSSTGAIRERDNILQEIQISYLLSKTASGSNTIDVGQFKIPIGYESLQSSGALGTIERALIFTQRDGFDGGYGDVRDTGIQLRGTLKQLEYRLGVFNGIGDRQNGLSLRDNKAVLARVSYRPTQIKGLEFGVSGGKGNTGVQTFLASTNAAGAVTTTSVTTRADRNLFNAFAAYKKDKLTLQGEYLTGKAVPITVASNATTGATTTAGRDVKGYYGHIGYLFTPKLEGILRYDYFDTNRDGANADVKDIVLGLNYYIKGNNAKIQTNLIKRNGGDNAPTSTNPSSNLRNDRLELRTAFQVAF